MAPTGSSILSLSKNVTENTTNIPLINPIIIAPNGDTLAQPVVIPTNPAKAPFKVIPTSANLYLIYVIKKDVNEAEAAARAVVTVIAAKPQLHGQR